MVVLALLSLSSSRGTAGRQRAEHLVLGTLAVAAAVFVLGRAGLGWLAVALVILWNAAQRFGRAARARRSETAPPPRPGRAEGAGAPRRMTRAEALEVLGLRDGATADEILAEYRRLMKKVHPDQGGTTYLARRLNEAKDVLIG